VQIIVLDCRSGHRSLGFKADLDVGAVDVVAQGGEGYVAEEALVGADGCASSGERRLVGPER